MVRFNIQMNKLRFGKCKIKNKKQKYKTNYLGRTANQKFKTFFGYMGLFTRTR